MSGKVIELGTTGTRLRIRKSQLLIDRPDEPEVTVPVEDIGVMIVDDIRATYTQSVLVSLVEAGAVVVISGGNHLPAGILLPVTGHHEQSLRHQLHLDATRPQCKRAWQQIIKAKIRLQGAVLLTTTSSDHGLVKFASRVRSGDTENREAQAAQRYWPRLFGRQFRRNRELPGINALLNYGYSVLRATIARSIVATGLIPTIGVQHRNRRNPFCLADDLLEPYRPMVDLRVKEITHDDSDAGTDLSRQHRARVLSILNEQISMSGINVPVSTAIQQTARSLATYFSRESDNLSLPTSLPMGRSNAPTDDTAGH
jgi:CRISPR-associated protein Cas1